MNDNVRLHYNKRPQLHKQQRINSNVYNLKCLNNWIKSVIISKFCNSGRVLDLCCGKGGDLLKWSKAQVTELTGVDIADVSIQQAKKRYQEGSFRFPASYYAGDCFSNPIHTIIPKIIPFDFISCQFALHYCFESETIARQAISNISNCLKKGGHFVGTIPNAYWIVKKLKSIDGLKFGNSCYSITFDQKEKFTAFGHRYKFALEDSIDDCPEYLIHFPTLERLANEFGMECVYEEPFHDFFYNHIDNSAHFELLKRMNVLNEYGTISADEWEVAGIYMAFAFKKII